MVPDQREWLARLGQLTTRLENRLRHALADDHKRLTWLEQRLQRLHPGQYLRQRVQRLDELEQRASLLM